MGPQKMYKKDSKVKKKNHESVYKQVGIIQIINITPGIN